MCLRRLAEYPDQIDLGGARLHYDPSRSDILHLVQQPTDPRVWATIVQIYDNLPPSVRTHSVPLADPHLPLLQRLAPTPRFSLITVLDLPRCPHLTDDTISALKPLHSLVAFDASDTPLTPYGINAFSQALQWVDDGPQRRGPWRLRILRLRCCSRINNSVYESLLKFPLLSVLDLRGTSCTLSDKIPFRPTAETRFFHPHSLSEATEYLATQVPRLDLYGSDDAFTLSIATLDHPPRPKTHISHVAPQDDFVVIPSDASRLIGGNTASLDEGNNARVHYLKEGPHHRGPYGDEEPMHDPDGWSQDDQSRDADTDWEGSNDDEAIVSGLAKLRRLIAAEPRRSEDPSSIPDVLDPVTSSASRSRPPRPASRPPLTLHGDSVPPPPPILPISMAPSARQARNTGTPHTVTATMQPAASDSVPPQQAPQASYIPPLRRPSGPVSESSAQTTRSTPGTTTASVVPESPGPSPTLSASHNPETPSPPTYRHRHLANPPIRFQNPNTFAAPVALESGPPSTLPPPPHVRTPTPPHRRPTTIAPSGSRETQTQTPRNSITTNAIPPLDFYGPARTRVPGNQGYSGKNYYCTSGNGWLPTNSAFQEMMLVRVPGPPPWEALEAITRSSSSSSSKAALFDGRVGTASVDRSRLLLLQQPVGVSERRVAALRESAMRRRLSGPSEVSSSPASAGKDRNPFRKASYPAGLAPKLEQGKKALRRIFEVPVPIFPRDAVAKAGEEEEERRKDSKGLEKKKSGVGFRDSLFVSTDTPPTRKKTSTGFRPSTPSTKPGFRPDPVKSTPNGGFNKSKKRPFDRIDSDLLVHGSRANNKKVNKGEKKAERDKKLPENVEDVGLDRRKNASSGSSFDWSAWGKKWKS